MIDVYNVVIISIIISLICYVGIIYIKDEYQYSKFLDGLDAADYFYEIIYDFCSKTDVELIETISDEGLKKFLIKNKEEEEFLITWKKYKLIMKKEFNKSELLKDLERILEEAYSDIEEIEEEFLLDSEVIEKEEVLKKIYNVRLLKREICELS